MTLLLLEALGALLLLVFIVWWTMFSGRRGGELVRDEGEAAPAAKSPPAAEPRPDDQPGKPTQR